MKILILNKIEFNNFMKYNNITDDNVESKDMMFISINNHNDIGMYMYGGDIYSHFKRQHSNVMIMHFGDFGEEFIAKVEHEGPTGIFNKYKAKKLYEFIKRNKDKRMAILHCGAGISRSYSVGLFIYDFFNENKNNVIKTNRAGSLNHHIFKLLKKQYYLDHHIPYPIS